MIPLLVPRPPAPHVLVCAYFSKKHAKDGLRSEHMVSRTRRTEINSAIRSLVRGAKPAKGNGGFLSCLPVAVSGWQWPRRAARAASPQRDGSIAAIPVVARPWLPHKFLAQHFEKNPLKQR